MSAPITEAIAHVRSEWGSNRRLRVGSYLILGSLWLYALLVLRDQNSVWREEWARTEARIARAKSTAAEGEWSTRAAEARVAVGELESLLWREGSIGLAQAQAQESVARSFTSAGIVPRSLRSALPDVGAANADTPSPIRLRAQFEFKPSTFYPWLSAITRGLYEKKPSFVVDSLVIRGGANAVVDVELIAYAVPVGNAALATPAVLAAPTAPSK
jgi:hypothetical protein